MEGYILAIREGIKNFRRGRTLSLAMTGCIAIAVFAMGTFGLFALNVGHMLERWESKVELVAFLPPGAEEHEAAPLVNEILSFPEVREARLVSGRDSWEELFGETRRYIDLSEAEIEEILPASIVIGLVSGGQDLAAIRSVAARVASIDGIDEVKFEEALLERYLRFRRDAAIFSIGTGIFWILMFAILSVNITRLVSARRMDEVQTLNMLGASLRFIRQIFTVEGLAQGISGALIGTAALAATTMLLSTRLGEYLRLPLSLFVAVFSLGPVLGILAGWLSVRNIRATVIALLVTLLSGAAYAGVEDVADTGPARYEKKLKRIEAELRESRTAAESIARQEGAIQDELDEVDKTIKALEEYIKTAEANIAANQNAVKTAGNELPRYEADYVRSKKDLEQWLRILCNYREPTMAEVILYDMPQSKMTMRREMTSRILQKEADALEHSGNMRESLRRQQETLRKRLELDRLYTKAARLRAEQLAAKRKHREILLTKLREQKSIYMASTTDMRTAAGNLQDMVDAWEGINGDGMTGSAPFREMKGLLPWPTEGKTKVPFGRVRNAGSPTYTQHYGIDIEAPAGSEVRAVHNGTVAYCEWFQGYGKLLIVDHASKYYSVYAHCSDISVQKGDMVKAGQTVAFVGETGSPKKPFLYFEIREDGRSVDPTAWLQRRNMHATQPK